MVPKHSREDRTPPKEAMIEAVADRCSSSSTVDMVVEVVASTHVQAITHGGATPRVLGESLQPMLNSCVVMLRKGNVLTYVCRHHMWMLRPHVTAYHLLNSPSVLIMPAVRTMPSAYHHVRQLWQAHIALAFLQ